MPETVSGSIRAAGGWIIAAQEPSNFGVEWEGQLGGQNSPTEAELEDFLTGLSGALSGGYVVGVDVVSTISEDPLVVAGEFGVYTPQIGGGVSYSGLIYDNGSSNPWIWQKWEWFVDEPEQGQ